MRVLISLICTVVMMVLRLVYRETSVITYVNLGIILLLIVIDYPSLKSGLITSIA